jgi:hypothetical protein
LGARRLRLLGPGHIGLFGLRIKIRNLRGIGGRVGSSLISRAVKNLL